MAMKKKKLFFENQLKALSFNLYKASQIFRNLYNLLLFSEFYNETGKTENNLKRSNIAKNIYINTMR